MREGWERDGREGWERDGRGMGERWRETRERKEDLKWH